MAGDIPWNWNWSSDTELFPKRVRNLSQTSRLSLWRGDKQTFLSEICFRLTVLWTALVHSTTLEIWLVTDKPYRYNFYRVMHYNVKRGLTIACYLSVCLFVTDIGGLWSHMLEMLEANCTDNLHETFALRSPKAIHLLLGEHWKIWGGDERWGGVGKSCVLEHKSSNISETHRGKITVEDLWELTTLFWPPTAPSPRLEVCNPHPKFQSKIAGKRVLMRNSLYGRPIGFFGE